MVNYAEAIKGTMRCLSNQFSYLTKFEPTNRESISIACRRTVQIDYEKKDIFKKVN